MKAMNLILTNGLELRAQVVRSTRNGVQLAAAPYSTDQSSFDFALHIKSDVVNLYSDDPDEPFTLQIGSATLELNRDLNEGLPELVQRFRTELLDYQCGKVPS